MALVPPGVIWEYGGVNLPDPGKWGIWLWANGLLVPIAQYPDLFGAITFSHSPVPGTDPGGGMFYLPNRKGRVGVGLDAGDGDFNAVGKSGGSKTTTATHAHSLSSHTHSLATHDHGLNGHVHSGNAHNHGLENHTHYTSTGGMSANWSHNHSEIRSGTGNIGLTPGGSQYNINWAGTNTGDTDTNHVHGAESGWFNNAQGRGGAENVGNTGGANGATTGANNVGGAAGPSTPNTGDGGQANGNLSPYVVVNYIVKV